MVRRRLVTMPCIRTSKRKWVRQNDRRKERGEGGEREGRGSGEGMKWNYLMYAYLSKPQLFRISVLLVVVDVKIGVRSVWTGEKQLQRRERDIGERYLPFGRFENREDAGNRQGEKKVKYQAPR